MSTSGQSSIPTEPIQIVILGKYALMASHIGHLIHPRVYISHFLKPSASTPEILRSILQGENCEVDAVILGWAWDREQAQVLREAVYRKEEGAKYEVKEVPWLTPDEASRGKGASANTKGMAGMEETVRMFAAEAASNIESGLENVRKQGGWGEDGVWEY